MKKKDSQLHKKLTAYTDDALPDERILEPALLAMREMKNASSADAALDADSATAAKSSEKKRASRGLKLGLSFGSLGLCLVILFSVMIYNLPGASTPDQSGSSESPSYSVGISLDRLNTAPLSDDDVFSTYAPMFPALTESPETEPPKRYRLYVLKDSGEKAFIMMRARVITDNGYEQVEIVRSLIDAYLAPYPDSILDEHGVYLATRYIDGEYLSSAAVKTDNMRTYIKVTAPYDDAAFKYINLVRA